MIYNNFKLNINEKTLFRSRDFRKSCWIFKNSKKFN